MATHRLSPSAALAAVLLFASSWFVAQQVHARGDDSTVTPTVTDSQPPKKDDQPAQPKGPRQLTDDELKAAVIGQIGKHPDAWLSEIVRRGGKDWEKWLSDQYLNPAHKNKLLPGQHGMLEFITALRRLQGKPDPLHIVIKGEGEFFGKVGDLPTLGVALKNVDELGKPITIQAGGNYRGGRQTRWRMEGVDQDGNAAPIVRPMSFISGGIFSWDTLRPGQTNGTTLPIGNYLDLNAPGAYTITVYYHNSAEIADVPAIVGSIVAKSDPITLHVAPIEIETTDQAQQQIANAIDSLPRRGPVKLIESPYTNEFHKFITPESAAGQLLNHGFASVLQLVDFVTDRQAHPTQRAWGLCILTALTRCNNPRHVEGILGTYELKYRMNDMLFLGRELTREERKNDMTKHVEGRIDADTQWKFAATWRPWKDDGYIKMTIKEHGR